VVSDDVFRKVFIWSIEFGRLVDEMENAERIKLEKVDHWFVVLEANVMCEFFEPFP